MVQAAESGQGLNLASRPRANSYRPTRSERNHQGLADALICPEPEHTGGEGEVHRRGRLGGLLNYYYRKAA
jgi:hypothetical protein